MLLSKLCIMLDFINTQILFWRIKYALWKCDKKNHGRTSDKYIVVIINKRPYVLNRPEYRKIRVQNYCLAELKWQDLKQKAITREDVV